MSLAETIKELASFILKGLHLIDHESAFLLRAINHRVTRIVDTLSQLFTVGTSTESITHQFIPGTEISQHGRQMYRSDLNLT